MNTIEFEAQICDGVLKVPSQYKTWLGKNVRVILLESNERKIIQLPDLIKEIFSTKF